MVLLYKVGVKKWESASSSRHPKPWLKKGDVKGRGVKDLSKELSAGFFLRKRIKCKIWRVRISGKAVGTCHLSWIVCLWGDRCASWLPPASTSARISPSNARICCLRNLDLSAQKSNFVEARMSEAFQGRHLFSFHRHAAVSPSSTQFPNQRWKWK